jgi:hypothetical protein
VKNNLMEHTDIKNALHALIDKTYDVEVLEAIRLLLHKKTDEQDFRDTISTKIHRKRACAGRKKRNKIPRGGAEKI